MNALPLGTVLSLKDGLVDVMIIGFFPNCDNEQYDYLATAHPAGLTFESGPFMFNESDIDCIKYAGYKDDKFDKFIDDVILYTNEMNEQIINTINALEEKE